MVAGHKGGAFMKTELLSQIEFIKSDKTKIGYEYQLLDALFNHKVQMALDYDPTMHEDRDRYSDILTYRKSAVKLHRGISDASEKFDSYINACYVNSPMCDGADGAGDGKIIASQGPLP